MRAFVAIDLPDSVRMALSDLQSGLRVGRHVPVENLHLTLAFLDDQPEATLRALHDKLCDLEPVPFELTLQGLELFGGKSPRVLFIKGDGGVALQDLRKQVRRAAQEVGIDLPRERFRPHVTLARFRRDMMDAQTALLGRFLERYGGAAVPPFQVEQFCLFGSTLHPDGAVHEPLAEYPIPAD